MSGLQETLCTLCRTNTTDKSFEVIDNATRDILHVLLLKLKFEGDNKEVICNACRINLNAALELKSACLNTDNIIIPHVDCEGTLQLDLREVYVKEKGSELTDISDNQKICRLCMQPVESEFRSIREEELEAIEKLAPEMIVNIVKDPVVCKPCFDSLCTHNTFLGDCSEMELSIKDECVDIKSEDEEKSDTQLQSSDIAPFEESECNDVEEDGCKHEDGSETEIKQEHKVFYKCDKCFYTTGMKSHLTAHCASHENNSELYKCETCKYETKNKKLLQRHRLRHKVAPEI
ncbi:uncharacterized protein LOC111692641, partial [Anoplophora glabripennis]|uniref:uncharacterized protein LOC111692641 n=1 Tax=Anoplophora glabripennis TaxID=217634 RepID=UPI000C76EA03